MWSLEASGLYIQVVFYTVVAHAVSRAAYQVVLKIVKLLLTAVADARYEVIASSCQSDATAVPPATYNQGLLLQQALDCIPNPNSERMTRTVAFKLGKCLREQVTFTERPGYSRTSVMSIQESTVCRLLCDQPLCQALVVTCIIIYWSFL